MYNEYVICLNPSCKFSKIGNDFSIKGCPLCGGEVLFQCPACGSRILTKKSLFCEKCLAPLKPPAEKNKIPRTAGSN